ncbi:serine hydrolase domain-containing protein [Streptomyces uncialis]|uniref:serine hydrolase domain-containing protein n=1 Tax=Streptomyces uncialis TaxID=1048205 RepID=UPI0022565836|nr:serine hydrolase domain-containing protein [Streptomyces uncialis]MCX4661623.1 beta-lactamase family protein [Streptomyces uncialis]
MALGAALALLGAGTLPAASTAAVDDQSGRVLRHDVDAIRSAGVTGVQAEVRTPRGRWSARSGVADLGTGRPVPRCGYFRMGSNTKTFVATVVLQLAGQRRLSLDDTVARWLPGVVWGNGNDGDRITLRQLLQQTSGLYDYTIDLPVLNSAEGYRRHWNDDIPPERLVAMAMRHKPGDRSWSYSNTNYVLLGMIIKKVTGRDWSTEVTDRILRPLHLTHTFAPQQWAYLPHPHARGYEQFTEGGPLIDTTRLSYSWAGPAGELITTTDDLTRFWQGLMSGRLLRPAQLAQMRTTVDTRLGGRYGLGIARIPLPCGGWYWTHPGSVPGYATRAGVTGDGRRAVVLSLSSRVTVWEPVEKATDTAIRHALCRTDHRNRQDDHNGPASPAPTWAHKHIQAPRAEGTTDAAPGRPGLRHIRSEALHLRAGISTSRPPTWARHVGSVISDIPPCPRP